MESIDDEDVIVKGSPLYEHLSHVGYTDCEVSEKCEHENNIPDPQIVPFKHKLRPLRNIFGSILQFCRLPFTFHRQCENWESAMFHSHCYEAIISTPSLLLEDAVVVKNVMEGFRHEISRPNLCNLFLTALIPIVPSFGVLYHFFLNHSWSRMYEHPSALLALLVIAIYAGEILRGSICFVNLMISKSTFNLFLSNEEKHATLLKKSIRAIQEMALASKGFSYKLTNQSSKLLENVSDKSLDDASKCVGLRQTIFTNCLYGIKVFSSSTKSMIKEVPLVNGMDVSSNYLSFMDFEEIVLKDLKKEKEHSIHSLKRLGDILMLLQSENLRRFSLCLIPSLQGLPEAKHCSSQHLSLLPQREVSVLVENLHLSYKIQQCSLMNRGDKANEKPHSVDSKKISKLDKLLAHVHNLDLHLQASLLRVRNLQGALQGVPDDVSLMKHESAIKDAIEFSHREIDASLVCLGETKMCLEKGSGDNMKKTQDTLSSEPKQTEEINEREQTLEYINQDPIIVDEVFEAYVTDSIGDIDHEKVYSEDDDNKGHKQQREQAGQVLRELRSILTVKAAEMKEREKMALKRLGKDDVSNSGGSSSSSLANSEEFQNDISYTDLSRLASENNLNAEDGEYNTDTSVNDHPFVKPVPPHRNHKMNRTKVAFTIGTEPMIKSERVKVGLGFEAVQIANHWLKDSECVEDSFGDDIDDCYSSDDEISQQNQPTICSDTDPGCKSDHSVGNIKDDALIAPVLHKNEYQCND